MRGGEYPRVRLWLKEKKLGKLKTWVNESRVDLDDISFFKTKLNHTMQARALLYLGREQSDGRYIADALGLLEKLSGLAESNGWGSKAIETLVLKALCYQACGDVNKAVATLEKALTLAEPGGFLRIFVDEGPPMARLLYDALDRGIAPAYVRRLLAAFPMTEPEGAASTKPRVDQAGLIEPLSERELEVLQLIARGLTNQAVATRLYLSLHTIKTHTRNIYSKLDVNNRTQAVAKARILGILPPN